MIKRCSLLIVAGLLFACDGGMAPSIEVSNVRVFAPLPGSRVSVAYLTLTNNSNADVTFDDFSSDLFRDVALHETTVSEGVARMRPLETLFVPAGTSIALREGSYHLMLMAPVADLSLGMSVTLTLRTASDSIVIRAPLEARIQVD